MFVGAVLTLMIGVFIYLSPNDFQTTNITPGIMPEGVNGFTEVFKKRVVVHFNGSYADFRHLFEIERQSEDTPRKFDHLIQHDIA